MVKLKNTLLFLILAYVLPLALRPELILHYKILILMGAAVTVFLTQPSFEGQEAKEHKADDQNSVVLILLFSLLATAIPVAEWGYWHPGRHHSVCFFAGLGLIVLGTGLRVWAIRTLGRFFTPTVQIQDGHRLIQEGPFAWVRHPSYTGALTTALGSAVLLESWWGLLVAAACMMIAYYLRITAEEKALVRNFGTAYEEYQRRSKRLIPGIW
jgi:protein-S-isoprenylcysteine O-methyltransferase Ste14